MRKYKNICIDTGRYNVATSAVFIYDYCFVLLPSVELILSPVSVSLCWWRWSVCRCSLTSAVGSAAACSTAALQTSWRGLSLQPPETRGQEPRAHGGHHHQPQLPGGHQLLEIH